MASAEDDVESSGHERVSDPSSRSFPSAKRRASMAAIEQLDRVKCIHMMSEYRQCISANHQFHQYYIHGQFSSCKMQKERMYNCIKWRTSHNQEAKQELLESFEKEQLAMHTSVPVWEMREAPPEDWSAPDPARQIHTSPSTEDSKSASPV